MPKPKVVTRKYNGDDQYSYAVFVDGKVVPELTGLNRPQATFYRNEVVGRLAATDNGAPVVKEKPMPTPEPEVEALVDTGLPPLLVLQLDSMAAHIIAMRTDLKGAKGAQRRLKTHAQHGAMTREEAFRQARVYATEIGRLSMAAELDGYRKAEAEVPQ